MHRRIDEAVCIVYNSGEAMPLLLIARGNGHGSCIVGPSKKGTHKMSDRDQESKSTVVNIPVNWHIPEDFPSPYASNMFAQAGEYEITISFFQTKLPLFTGTQEENKAKLEQLGIIQAECVSRIIVNPELVPKIIQALQATYDGYVATKNMIEGSKKE